MPPEPALRAADRDREQTAAVLGDHMATGRLSLAEFHERLTAAYAATTIAELEALVRDLPAAEPVAATSSSAEEDSRPVAGASWSRWLFTGVVCLVIWVLTSAAAGRPLYFWPGWVIGPWGLLLAAGQVFGVRGQARNLEGQPGSCGLLVRYPRCGSRPSRHSTSNQECAS